MKRMLFCCLLLTGICLSGCTGQSNQPDAPPSTSEESGALPGAESEESTERSAQESTIPGEASKQALTLTCPAFIRAPRLYCIVPAASKARAVERTLHGPVSEDCPATILRQHPAAALYLDAESAGLL